MVFVRSRSPRRVVAEPGPWTALHQAADALTPTVRQRYLDVMRDAKQKIPSKVAVQDNVKVLDHAGYWQAVGNTLFSRVPPGFAMALPRGLRAGREPPTKPDRHQARPFDHQHNATNPRRAIAI